MALTYTDCVYKHVLLKIVKHAYTQKGPSPAGSKPRTFQLWGNNTDHRATTLPSSGLWRTAWNLNQYVCNIRYWATWVSLYNLRVTLTFDFGWVWVCYVIVCVHKDINPSSLSSLIKTLNRPLLCNIYWKHVGHVMCLNKLSGEWLRWGDFSLCHLRVFLQTKNNISITT